MRYCSTQDAVTEVSRYALKNMRLGLLWLKFIRKHPNLNEEILKAVAQNENWRVRWTVARWRQDLPIEVLRTLAQDDVEEVRRSVKDREARRRMR